MPAFDQTQLDQLLKGSSKPYKDPADREMLVLKETEAERLTARFQCHRNQIYRAALKQEIWPHRYVRNQGTISLGEQLVLAESTVAVIGSGGLGGTLILLLARLGIGQLIVIDHDVFDETNLNRQMISSLDGLGQSKSREAERLVGAINPGVKVKAHQTRLDESSAIRLLEGSDLIADALDNIRDRLLLQKIARELKIPFVHGAIAGFDGQVMTVFPEDKGLDLLYGENLPEKNDPKRPEAVMGVPTTTPALIATFQAMEVIKVILGRGRILRNRLLHVDLETSRFNEFSL